MVNHEHQGLIHGPGWRPDIVERLGLNRAHEQRLADFCERWRVADLELFGSVLRPDFGPNSDVDLLVTFHPGADWGLMDHGAMEEALAGLLGRPVDLLTRRSVERSANELRRASILDEAVLLVSTIRTRQQPNVSVPESPDRDQATLADILRACRLAIQFIEGLDRDSFLGDLKTQAAVLHEITIIGEGVKRLSDDLRIAYPGIPWRLIAGMRDRLIHQYDTVDLEEVWRTVTADIPRLIQDLERLRSAS